MVCGLFTQAAFAQGSIYYFPTVEEAQKYCPSLTNSSYDLIFKSNSYVDHSAGIISGKSQNNSLFLSANNVLEPMSWNSQTGIINDAQFRSIDGNYGFISGDKTTCYYAYQGWTGVTVYLNMSN